MIGAVLSGISLFISSNIKEIKANKKRAFDKIVNTEFLKTGKSELEKKNFQLLYKDKPFYSYSSIVVELFNYSDKDYSKIPIHIYITPADNDTLTLVENIVAGSNGFEESVTTLKLSTDTLSGKLKSSYLLEAANSADSLGRYVFHTSFLVLCKEKPTVNVTIEKDGLLLREYSYKNFNKEVWYESDNWFLIFFLTGYGIFIVLLVKVLSFLRANNRRKWKKFLKKELDELIEKNKIELNSESIIKSYDELDKRFDYENASLLKRWVKKMKDPDDKVDNNNL